MTTKLDLEYTKIHTYIGIFDDLGRCWNGSEIYVGNSIQRTIPAQTKFWSFNCSLESTYAGQETPSTVTKQEPYIAINRTAHIFPYYTDTWSGKKASDGLRTDWIKVSNPVSYDSRKDKQVSIAGYDDLNDNGSDDPIDQ